MKTLKTILHYYRFDVSIGKEAKEWEKLVNTLEKKGILRFCAWSGSINKDNEFLSKMIKPLDGFEIELETECLFSNQWNSAPTLTSKKGIKLMDWSLHYLPNNSSIKTGYYLEITEDMKWIREHTYVCGYCGKHYKHSGFCSHYMCLGSRYLKKSELHLLRLLPIALFMPTREPLTEDEYEKLVAHYQEVQGEKHIEYENSRHKCTLDNLVEAIGKESLKHDGIMLLIKHHINPDLLYCVKDKRFYFRLGSMTDDKERGVVKEFLSREFPWRCDIDEKRRSMSLSL